MRKIYSLLLALVLFSVAKINAQITVVSGGTGLAASYTSLTQATGLFAALNATAQSGAIVITVTGNTTEDGAISLNAGTWTSISITASGGAARTMTGAPAGGTPLINFNGADNVTINGLNTGGNSLTISNTTVAATSNTSTIRFIADATNNTITNCSILGSSTMAVGTNGGNILFAAGAVTTGNDNNTISNCNIGPAGSNLPTKGIHCGGSSNTDPGTANSGLVFNNNNIFDFFSATAASAGVYITSGTVGTTISNNRFYQTATRTQTTGAQHSPIYITNTSGNAYSITGNTIGFANSGGTGSYTFAGTTSSLFWAIYLNVGATTATSIQGNTIAGISFSGSSSGTGTSAPFIGVFVPSTGGMISVGNVTGNLIGSMSATGNISYTSSSSSASDVYAIYNFGTANFICNNNNIGGISAANSSTGAASIYAIRCNTGTGLTMTCSNNVIGGSVANSISSTSTAIASLVHGIQNDAPIGTFTGNKIRNLSAAGGTGTTTSASVIGICITSAANQTLTSDTVFSLSNSNASAATIVTGLQVTGSTANTVERCLVYGLTSSTNSTTAEVNGIRVAGGTTTYRNNMIVLGAGIANAIGAAATNAGNVGINGILDAGGTNNFYHNSVYIGGTATAGAGASYAFNGTVTTNTRAYRDNIFFNARTNSGATGKHYAVKINGTASNPAGLTINNNIYFANGTGGVFGFFNSLDVANLAAWKAATGPGQDAASFESNPQYLDPTNATPDLHIHPTNTTAAEGNGVDVGVTNDFDGQTRSGLTPTDIGADAGNFTGIDLTAPVITYTPLGNTIVGANQTLTVTVTDVSGVPTSGAGLPRLYYKINTGTYTSVTGVSIGSNQYTFTFGSATTTAGDIVSYYVVAQDGAATPNVTSFPVTGAAGFTANPPAASTPPTTPSTFTATAAISGTITVPGTYASLTLAGGAFEAINNATVTGNVTIQIAGDLTGENGTIKLNEFASPYTVTIKPTGVARSITGSSTGSILGLNGADRVTIDGSLGSTVNSVCSPTAAATRDLTITNTNAGTSSAVIWLQTNGSNGATNNNVINCNLVGSGNTQTLFAVGSGSSTISTTSLGTGNNSNSFVNNNISKVQHGIYSQGASAANKNTGTVINQNLINAASPNNVQFTGIRTGFESGITISGNNIGNLSGNGTGAAAITVGISLGLIPFNQYTVFTGNEVVGATVSNNIINGVLRNGDGSAVGISVAAVTTAASAANTLSNNMITGVRTVGATPSDFPAGILIGGGAQGSTNVYYNSVLLTGVGTNSSPGFAIAIGESNPVVNLRNNIFVNKMTTTTGKMYAIGLGSSTYTNLTSNNNNYFTTAAPIAETGGLGAAGTDQATLAAWQTTTGKDANSKNIDPVFIGATDLHLNNTDPTNIANLDGTGAVVSVTTDIDCATRNATTPDIGADEFTAPNCTGATAGTASGSTTFCTSGTPTITATGYSSGNTTTYQWYSSTVAGDYPNAGTAVGGQTNPASLTTGVVSTTTYYWLRVTCTAASATDNSTLVTVTINPTPGAVTVNGAGTFCTSTSISATGGSGGTIYFQGTTTGGTATNLGSTPQTITTSGTYYFRAEAAGCWGTEGSAAVVIQTPAGITGTNASICAGASGSIQASAANCTGFINSGTTLNGTFTAGDAQALRPTTSIVNNATCSFDPAVLRGYQAQQFQVNVSGTYTFDMTSTDDGMAYITSGAFVPGNCSGGGTWLRGDDDSGPGNDPQLAMTLTAGVTYTLYSTTYSLSNGNSTAAYSWAITPPSGGQIMLPATGSIDWYTAASGGSSIGTGSPFNPVGVLNSGLANTNTPGTTPYYAACSLSPACRTQVNFVINANYTVTASSGANGSVTPTGVTTLSCDGTGSQAYTITPAACYSIASLTVDGNPVSLTTGSFATGGTYVFSNVTANHTINATFALNTYTVTVNAGANGSITPGTGSVNCGDNATYTITPDACYSIASLTVDGNPVSLTTGSFATGGTYVLSNITANHTIAATFVQNTFTVTVSAGTNGSITPATGSVNCGANATYTITPDACYSIASLTVDGNPVSLTTGSFASGGTYVFSNVTAAHSISATFVINTYTIAVSAGANGSITPGTGSVNCGDNATYTITPNSGYSISDVTVDGTPATPLTTGSYAAGGTYVFSNVNAAHSISATFVINCINVGITNVTASNPGPLCSGQTTNLTANGVVGTNAVVTWWTGPNGTGANVGTGTTLNGVGANTYYARVTGGCGTPQEASITINSIGNTFTGTGNWTDNARWSCGAPPGSGDAVTIAAGAVCTLNTNFLVSGSLTMNATSTLVVNPTRTLSIDVAATANFNGQSVTFQSDNSGTASLGQVNGTLSGATNVTVERYIPNNGFRSWRLLSVPVTTTQTIRQAWQEGDANPNPKDNNIANRGTQITGVFGTQAAAAAAGFDSTSVQAGMLRWNGTGWSNITSTNQAINNFNSYFLYIRGERGQTVTGSVNSSSATTLRTKGTVFTGDQATNVGANAFALVPNLYPSAISFTGLTRTGGVNNLFYIWDSKKLNGNSLGVYQTFSNTNSFNCMISGGSYTLGQPNTTIESGQSFFVTSSTSGAIILKESAKVSGTNGSLGFRPSGIKRKLDTKLYNNSNEMLDANAVVFDAAYNKAVSEEDAPKLGNPGANFAVETDSKLLAIAGTQPVQEGDAIQYRMWNLAQGTYTLELAASNLSLPAGVNAILEDSYLQTSTTLDANGTTSVQFAVDQAAGSSKANRFRVVFAKGKTAVADTKQGYSIAPNPIENGVMNLVLSNKKAGKYSVRILATGGQSVMIRTIVHAGGTANQSISLPATMGRGTYTVEITAPDRSRTTQTVFVNGK